MPRVVQWLNENAHRAYPLVEDSDRSTTGGIFPDNVLVDLQLLDIATAADRAYITQITVSGAYMDLTVAYGAVTRTLTASLAGATYTPTNYGVAAPYRLTAIWGPGVVDVIGWGDGVYTFTTPPEIEPTLLNFEARHRVDSIQALDPSANVVLSGIIHVLEGYNCRVNILPNTDTVIVSALRGAGRGIACEVEGDPILLCADALLSINGLKADSSGNFLFMGGPGVQVTADPENNSITFTSGLNDTDKTRCG